MAEKRKEKEKEATGNGETKKKRPTRRNVVRFMRSKKSKMAIKLDRDTLLVTETWMIHPARIAVEQIEKYVKAVIRDIKDIGGEKEMWVVDIPDLDIVLIGNKTENEDPVRELTNYLEKLGVEIVS